MQKALTLALFLAPFICKADPLDEKLARPGGPSVADYVQYRDQPRMQAYVLGYARAVADVNFLQLLPGSTRFPFLCTPEDKQFNSAALPFGNNFTKEAVLRWLDAELKRATPVQNRLFGQEVKPREATDLLQTAVLLAVTNNYSCGDGR